MPKHLTKRGKVWYVTAVVNGKRISQSLNTSVRETAMVRARAVVRAAQDSKWESILNTRSKSCYPTVKEYLDQYRVVAAEHERQCGKPRPASVQGYCWSLLHIIEIGTGSKEPGQQRLDVLTRELLEKFVALTVQTGNPALSERDRRSAHSLIRSARACFSKWAVDAMRDMSLPKLTEFMTCRVVESAPVRYRMPPEALVRGTISAARDTMRQERPDLYAAFLLCHDLGLRAGEATQAQWDWIREATKDGKTRRYLDIIRRDTYQPKGRQRSVPVAGTVWEQLQEIRRGDNPWILQADTPSGREDLVKRGLADWMRAQGWDRHHYPKAAHELRKLIGSEWYTRFGAEVASNWLGHADVTTTCRYYADLTRHPEPIEIE